MSDLKAVVFGLARVCWGDATVDQYGKVYKSGWVIPGGWRTKDRDVAERAAKEIDRLMR